MKSGLLRELTFDDSGLVRVELQQLYKERTKGVYYVGFMLFFLEIKLNFKGNCYKNLFTLQIYIFIYCCLETSTTQFMARCT